MNDNELKFTTDELRVIALACERLYNSNPLTKDGLTAHKIEVLVKSSLISEYMDREGFMYGRY